MNEADTEITSRVCKRKALEEHQDEPAARSAKLIAAKVSDTDSARSSQSDQAVSKEELDAEAMSFEEYAEGAKDVPLDEERRNECYGEQKQDELSEEEMQWTCDNDIGMIILETISIIVVHTKDVQTKERRAHITCFQEHSMNGVETRAAQADFSNAGLNMLAGPMDPEHGRKSGGVGVHCRSPLRSIPLQPITGDFKDAMKTGRCMAYMPDIASASVTVVCIYGWSGGHQNPIAAARTDDLIPVVRNELSVQHKGHQLICGDINGEPEDFPKLMAMITEEGWTDTGAKADTWGVKPCQPTAKPS